MRRHAASLGLDRHVAAIAAVVIVGAIMSILDTTIVNIALETLARELHASLDDVQWVATGYLLSLALVIPLTGWASERFGARRVWLWSVALFSIGSVLCGAGRSLRSVIFLRVLQGEGGGMIMPVGMIMLAQAAGPQRMGRLMSIVGVPMLLAPVVGPALGGPVSDDLCWRWIFLVNLPVGLIGLVLGSRLLPRAKASTDAGRLDWLGLLLLSPGLSLLVFALAEVSTHGGLGAVSAWLPLVSGVALIAAFVLHALRAARPLIDVRLFGERAFSAAAGTTFLVAMSLFGSLILLPLFFQIARGETALAAGLLQAPQGLGVALAMPFTGVMTDRVGGGRVVLFGLAVLTASTIPLALLEPGTSLASIGLVLFVRGVGVGATMMPVMAAAYAVLDHAAVPRATSALNVIQRVGGSIGTALLAVVLQRQLADAHGPAAVAHGFGHVFWWAIAMTVLAALPALVLVRATSGAPVPATAVVAGDSGFLGLRELDA